MTGLRDYVIVVLFCATDARLGEVIRLKVQDVNFARGLVTFRDRNNDDAEIVLTENVQAVFRRLPRAT